jgi:hypothetical protein
MSVADSSTESGNVGKCDRQKIISIHETNKKEKGNLKDTKVALLF